MRPAQGRGACTLGEQEAAGQPSWPCLAGWVGGAGLCRRHQHAGTSLHCLAFQFDKYACKLDSPYFRHSNVSVQWAPGLARPVGWRAGLHLHQGLLGVQRLLRTCLPWNVLFSSSCSFSRPSPLPSLDCQPCSHTQDLLGPCRVLFSPRYQLLPWQGELGHPEVRKGMSTVIGCWCELPMLCGTCLLCGPMVGRGLGLCGGGIAGAGGSIQRGHWTYVPQRALVSTQNPPDPLGHQSIDISLAVPSWHLGLP